MRKKIERKTVKPRRFPDWSISGSWPDTNELYQHSGTCEVFTLYCRAINRGDTDFFSFLFLYKWLRISDLYWVFSNPVSLQASKRWLFTLFKLVLFSYSTSFFFYLFGMKFFQVQKQLTNLVLCYFNYFFFVTVQHSLRSM